MKKPDPPVEINFVKNILIETHHYCHLAEKYDFVSVTEWANGEGYDINISRKTESHLFNLTHGEIAALKKAIREIEKRDKRTAKVVQRAAHLIHFNKMQVSGDSEQVSQPPNDGYLPF